MENLTPKKIFKKKKSVKTELLNALEHGIQLNYLSLAKLVGISVHRVKKYCKNHNIDLNNYNAEIVNQKKIKKDFEENQKNAKKRKVQIETIHNKIDIGEPKNVKATLR